MNPDREITFWFNGVAEAAQIVEKAMGDHPGTYENFNLGGMFNNALSNAHIGMLDEVRISELVIPEPSIMLSGLVLLALMRRK